MWASLGLNCMASSRKVFLGLNCMASSGKVSFLVLNCMASSWKVCGLLGAKCCMAYSRKCM